MKKPMTKTVLVAALVETGLEKKTAAGALDALDEIVSQEVAAGGAVTLPGIGKVVRREWPERTVCNLATEEQMTKADQLTAR